MRISYEQMINALEQTVKDEFHIWFSITNENKSNVDGQKYIENFNNYLYILRSYLRDNNISSKEHTDIYCLIYSIEGCLNHIKQCINYTEK